MPDESINDEQLDAAAEYQDEEGEAARDDDNFAHVAAWEFTGDPMKANRHKEELEFETIHLAKRSYK